MNDQDITTILGKGSSFSGKLTFEGTVRIDGVFAGEIQTDGTLVIGESAQVEAEIRAATVVVQGVVRGDVTATSALELHAPARIYGNIAAPSLMIQKGAIFQGSCRMEGEGVVAQAPLANGKDKSSVAHA
jgi:cytoskeletal protein CcmA (bactofilin family)